MDRHTPEGVLAEIRSRLNILERRRPGVSGGSVSWNNVVDKPTEFPPTQATTTVVGGAEIATGAEVAAGTDNTRMVTPLNLLSRTATESRTGLVRLSTGSETQAGTDATVAVTPASLSTRGATESRTGLAEIATAAEVAAFTDGSRYITPAALSPVVVAARGTVIGAGVDFDTITTPGAYNVNNAAAAPNFPSGSYGYGTLLVVGPPGNPTTQIYAPHTSGSSLSTYPVTRTKYNASDWGGWRRFVPDASDTMPGITEYATAAEITSFTANRSITPQSLRDSHGYRRRVDTTSRGVLSAAWVPMQYPTEEAAGPGSACFEYLLQSGAGVFILPNSGVYSVRFAQSFATRADATGRRLVRLLADDVVVSQKEYSVRQDSRLLVNIGLTRWFPAGTGLIVQLYHTQGVTIGTGVEPSENFAEIVRIS